MLTIGQHMNDFIISAASTQWRAGRPDGAAILGVKEDEDGTREYVTAMLGQHEIDRPEPAESWAWGHYFNSGTHEDAAADALRDWTERAGVSKAESRPPAAAAAMPTARLLAASERLLVTSDGHYDLEHGLLLCGHEDCQAVVDTLQEAGYTRDWGLDVRQQDGREEDAGQEVDASGLVVTAVFHGLEDFSDDGDDRYYLVCRKGHHSEPPFETWNWD